MFGYLDVVATGGFVVLAVNGLARDDDTVGADEEDEADEADGTASVAAD
ncbi:hypothetical protein [Halobaculum marinum]|uniref:Uncharacterized protein n=1 Tax=Halobaculum marinum TaxID=3031996 RepID=A0ABD5WTH2_9EURY|nr:hypothetical protein [Halobaculum sp. DT55]